MAAYRHRNNRAFTLVELLIVIVVIAILAAISVVAYNGIHKRAQISAAASTAKQFASVFEAYAAIHGSFPGANWACLGDATTLPAEDGYAEGYCFTGSIGLSPSSPQVQAAMAEVATSVPDARTPEVNYTSTSRIRGMTFDAESGTNSYKGVITYYLPWIGDDVCAAGRRVTWNTTYGWTRCEVPLSTDSHGS